jgi:thiosulfate/3-mercaptopyruvate sulfurtransferase
MSPPETSLISAPQLKRWIDAGYVDDWGFGVVVLDTGFDWSFDTRAVYEAGHIPGAHYVEPTAFYEMVDFRSDGPVLAQAMVPDGPAVDAFVQMHGIDGYTTVVLTGNHIWGPARAYWALRYWGFSSSQLFVLDGRANGEYSVWTEYGYELETEEPPLPEPSDFSVSELRGNMDEVRASTEEFLGVIGDQSSDTVIVDARSVGEWYGYISPETNIFGFRINSSVLKTWSELLVGGEEGTHRFRPAAQLAAEFDALGVTADKTMCSFCQAGGRAAVLFFACDGILRRPAKIHDGSSIELGQLGCMTNDEGTDLGLLEDSPWRFDLRRYCAIINYNDPTLVQPPVVLGAYAEGARLVNRTDSQYSEGE